MQTDSLTLLQREALAQYNRLRQRKTSIIMFGRLCRSFLNREIWRSQSELASALGISKPHVTRLLRAAKVPDEVIHTFGDAHRISFETVETLAKIEKRTGRMLLIARAVSFGARSDLKVHEILAGLATGFLAPIRHQVVRLTRHKEEGYIRLYSPQLTSISSDLPRLERAINAVLIGVLQLI
ncbi:transcriptional regulator with XRE-family HTH domain [Paraburkholderia atlantica]|uniref:Transcriptional regulator with XRE-family HTH domain n=1 Tax=Paraburkholderia youngii TaxID=2782701 RepID=A0A7W8LDS5_9BURK|nr:hypothetical protein [Paraburkholderia youngii]MBB5405170.1 transcriptional regulator with XRE-family HTH domain [Paraburkholderia youngii]